MFSFDAERSEFPGIRDDRVTITKTISGIRCYIYTGVFENVSSRLQGVCCNHAAQPVLGSPCHRIGITPNEEEENDLHEERVHGRGGDGVLVRSIKLEKSPAVKQTYEGSGPHPFPHCPM